MIKAIVFDWGGVLIDYPVSASISYCAELLTVDKELFEQTFKQYVTMFQKGELTEDMLWEKISKKLKIQKPTTPSLCREAFHSAYTPKKEMLQLAANLKKNGYKIGFLSNTELPMMNYVKEQHYDMFDVTVFSCVEGTVKPERQIYEILLERLRVKAYEVVLIDDIKEYIKAARDIGMKGILFENPQQVKRELAVFGVRI
jgi:putative hydrolase of the HAD superfamily